MRLKNPLCLIPLISQASQSLSDDTETFVNYHIKEWEWVNYLNHAKKNKTIIPVVIDDTGWMYESFKAFYYVRIPGGHRDGDYEKLKDKLLELQKQPQ
jgi:hypothetical protein